MVVIKPRRVLSTDQNMGEIIFFFSVYMLLLALIPGLKTDNYLAEYLFAKTTDFKNDHARITKAED